MSDVYKQALERMFGKSTSNIWEGVANGTCLPPKPLPEIEVLQGIASHDYSKTTLRDQFAMAATEEDIELYMISDDVEDVLNDYQVMRQHVMTGVRYARDNRTKAYTREQARYRFADAMMEARK